MFYQVKSYAFLRCDAEGYKALQLILTEPLSVEIE
jgi:hypothetical protein